jgi:hypothetical protein
MANEILVKTGIQFLFADHATDFGAAPTTAANSLIIGAPTDVQMDLTSLAASGGGYHSAQVDLTTPWGRQFLLMACLEFAAAPTDGGNVDFWWAPSPSSTAATGNPGGVTGSAASYTETTGTLGQLQYIGTMLVRNNVLNIAQVGVLRPSLQYGSLVIRNNADQALNGAAGMDETHITLTEIIDELQ